MKDSHYAILLIIIGTIFSTFGQIMLKFASLSMTLDLFSIINPPLFLGLLGYGGGAIFLISALKKGRLSLVYPFLALSYIWVSIASIIIFNEQIPILRWLGIGSIIFGVGLLGRSD